MSTLMRLLGFLRPFAGWVLLSILLGVGTVFSGIGLMGTSAYLISRAALQPSIAVLQIAIVGVRFFGLSRGIFRYLERLVSHSLNFHLLARIRTWFYDALEPLAPARLMEYQSGDLLDRAIGDIETLEDFYIRVISPPLVAIIITTGVGFYLGGFDPSLAMVYVVGLFLSGIVIPVILFLLSQGANRRFINARAQLSASLVESVQGIEELLAFGLQTQRLEMIHSQSELFGKSQKHLALLGGLKDALLLLSENLTLWFILLLAIPLVVDDRLEGVLLAVLALVTISSFEIIAPLGQLASTAESSLQAAKRLFSIADSEPAVKTHPSPALLPDSYDLEIRDLSFTYSQSLPLALNEINLHLPAGKKVAIVGPNGAGKSTLINLLLRFWDFERGEIRIGNQDMRQFHPADIRSLFGVVSQNSYLFDRSIRENLLLARRDASDEELLSVIKRVRLYDWILELPDGLDTWIGENGLKVSGGERQRLIIARTLLQNTPIWLLDEPASHLDPITEQAVSKTINEATENRSILQITHRLSGLERMDEIIML
ncbi:MAG: thiol reductant ABC exporter subunit CydC, partial [Anaerolineaceae bacterium]|nr:thiol reductant ABC exporter subunit CydC [Anaerolineaceae bacterium]